MAGGTRRVKIMGLPKCKIVWESPSALMMINPMISPRNRTATDRAVLPRWSSLRQQRYLSLSVCRSRPGPTGTPAAVAHRQRRPTDPARRRSSAPQTLCGARGVGHGGSGRAGTACPRARPDACDAHPPSLQTPSAAARAAEGTAPRAATRPACLPRRRGARVHAHAVMNRREASRLAG
jgi:hypothetical protein